MAALGRWVKDNRRFELARRLKGLKEIPPPQRTCEVEAIILIGMIVLNNEVSPSNNFDDMLDRLMGGRS